MKSGKCVKCSNEKIIESVPADFGDNNLEIEMCVTSDPRLVMSGRKPSNSYGHLKLLICSNCGYSEWWTENPEDIPIGKDYKTRYL